MPFSRIDPTKEEVGEECHIRRHVDVSQTANLGLHDTEWIAPHHKSPKRSIRYKEATLLLDPRMKFLAQLIVALVLTLIGGILVSYLGDIFSMNRPLGLSFFAIPFTIISVIGLINAFNMIDGHDGLAGMVALLGLAGLSVLLFFRATPDDHQYLVVIFLLLSNV